MLLLDNSAFARLSDPRLDRSRVDEIAELTERREIAVCLPFLLEVGVSARNEADHRRFLRSLRPLNRLHINPEVEEAAFSAHAELIRVGRHRLPPVDLMIAATADQYRTGVLHYDAHYDVIAEKTSLEFDSVWLADRGSL